LIFGKFGGRKKGEKEKEKGEEKKRGKGRNLFPSVVCLNNIGTCIRKRPIRKEEKRKMEKKVAVFLQPGSDFC